MIFTIHKNDCIKQVLCHNSSTYISCYLQWPRETFSCWNLRQVHCPSVLPGVATRTANLPRTTPWKPLRRRRKSVATSSIMYTYHCMAFVCLLCSTWQRTTSIYLPVSRSNTTELNARGTCSTLRHLYSTNVAERTRQNGRKIQRHTESNQQFSRSILLTAVLDIIAP